MSQPDSILAAELRGARPVASPELRTRVREIAARPPEPRRLRRPELRLRRALLVLAPAAVVAGLGAALAGGIVGFSSSPRKHAAPGEALSRADQAQTLAPQAKRASGAQGGAVRAAPVPASPGRAQSYEAEMRLRVSDLSRATKRALQLTQGLGGYVRSVDYGSGTARGTAVLVVRIPVGGVQEAIVRFAALGAILDQRVSIRDVQPQIDARFRRLQGLRKQIAAIQTRLADPKLSADERRVLQARLAQLRTRLVAVQREQAQAQKRASFATVSLDLTTRKAAASGASRPGRVERALDHAATILLRELVVLVYVVLVGVPLLLLALLLLAGERARRRRSTERLLAS